MLVNVTPVRQWIVLQLQHLDSQCIEAGTAVISCLGAGIDGVGQHLFCRVGHFEVAPPRLQMHLKSFDELCVEGRSACNRYTLVANEQA